MYSRISTRLIDMLHSFWFLPGVMIVLAVALAETTIALDEHLKFDKNSPFWLFKGGVEGARTLLGGIATSILGVAGTVFSITIAALSIAANQMGPRLMESFTRDWRNSFSLATFLATVAYTFMVLRSVQGSGGEPGFIPHLSVSLSLVLTLVSLFVLIYFIQHVGTSINVGYVIRLVHDDLHRTLENQTVHGTGRDEPPAQPPEWSEQDIVYPPRSGYLQSVDINTLTRLAEQNGAVVRLLVRPGDFIMKNVPVALVTPRVFNGINAAFTIGKSRTTNQDVEYAVRKLVEVASRALSPGLNDPYTAMAVLDHLGDALCFLHDRALPDGRYERDGQLRLFMPVPDFQGLVETMFNLIRQYGKSHPAVTIRMLEVLTQAAACLTDPLRREVLRTHAELTRDAALENTQSRHDREAVERRYERFLRVCEETKGSTGGAGAPPVERHE